MISLAELRERLAELTAAARASWKDDELAAARQAWDAYDRIRLSFTIAVQASFEAYATLRAAGPTVIVPTSDLTAGVARISADVDAVVQSLARSEQDLYRAADQRTQSELRAIDGRRSAIADLQTGLEVWRAVLQSELRVHELQVAGAPAPSSPCEPVPSEDAERDDDGQPGADWTLEPPPTPLPVLDWHEDEASTAGAWELSTAPSTGSLTPWSETPTPDDE